MIIWDMYTNRKTLGGWIATLAWITFWGLISLSIVLLSDENHWVVIHTLCSLFWLWAFIHQCRHMPRPTITERKF